MKRIILISILIVISQIVSGQKKLSKIDRLSSKQEVEKYIFSLSNRFEEFTLIEDSLNIQPFSKIDFDKNGLTDLLAIGTFPIDDINGDDLIKEHEFHILVVMDYGKDSFQMISLTRGFIHHFVFPKIVNDSIITLNQKALIFKFGDFIEFNPHPKKYEIEKIEYQTAPCYGTCPVFRIEINKDKTGLFKASNYNSETEILPFELPGKPGNSKEIKGVFRTVVRENSYSNIIDLLNYIDFPNLKNNYSVAWTDDQSSTLTITYNNGQKKEIRDYGLIGTYGLDRLYQLFFELRFNQKWE
ncbi:MAG TPA: DUF6438 domain-containing protein [Chitinophagaceae bacterium]|nr:DUF6438 domain-containing protein [Chitinophagaceae bacterium]